MRLVYFSPVSWYGVPQRPHHLIRYFLKHGGREVLWVEPTPGRLPQISDVFRLGTRRERFGAEMSGVEITSVGQMPVDPIPGLRGINGVIVGREGMSRIRRMAAQGAWLAIGKPTSPALRAVSLFERERTLYDAMDDFPEFFSGISRWSARLTEEKIAGAVGMVLASSDHLAGKFRRNAAGVKLVPNAYDPNAVRTRSGGGNRLRLGFVGTVGEWVDWALIERIAEAVPEFQIEVIGPVHKRVRVKATNIIIEPPCGHADAMARVAGFGVGLIPFRETRLTRAVDPIKYYEYRATGIATLSTRFGQMDGRGEGDGVFFVNRAQGLKELSEVVYRALDWTPDEEDQRNWLNRNTWDARFQGAELFGQEFAS